MSAAARFRVLVPALSAGFLALAGTGCGGSSCKLYASPSLRVRVIDAAGAPVCDATVVAHDGSFSGALRGLPGDASTPCFFTGPEERAGTYRIDVTARGATATASAKVSADSCHVRTQDVTVALAA